MPSSWWRPSYDDNGSRWIRPDILLRDALAREAPPTDERRSRSRLACNAVKLVDAQLRRQRLPLDIFSQFARARPGHMCVHTEERRSRSRGPRTSVKLVGAQLTRQRLPFNTSSRFTPRRPGQRGPPTQECRSRRDFLAIHSIWCVAHGLISLTTMAA